MADRASEFHDIKVLQRLLDYDGVRRPGVDECPLHLLSPEGERETGPDVHGVLHMESDRRLPHFSVIDMVQCLEALVLPGDPLQESKPRNAPPPVAAHPSRASVCVVVEHREIRPGAFSEDKESVSSDAEVSVADSGGKAGEVDAETPREVVDEDKIVSGAGSFCE